ncbi:MAG: phosphotransferase [Candidatus Paceibacterota bacterium]|jgi:Ser/Thr protein kinase RdoA (MazF antagonist)
MNQTELNQIAEIYGLGRIQSAVKNEKGLVNDTYYLKTDRGHFMAQKLNPIFTEAVVEDHDVVARHLLLNDFLAPKIVEVRDNVLSARISGALWKVCYYIPHDEDVKVSDKTVVEAAAALGRFHGIMGCCPLQPKFKIPNFHETRKIIEKLSRVFLSEEYAEKAMWVTEIYHDIVGSITKHYLPTDLSPTLIHGDPKFDNFLFRDGEVVGMFDLDTVMLGHELLDLGDAFRSWCRESKTEFNLNRFNLALKAYRSKHNLWWRGGKLIGDDLVKDAVALITLELAARYLIDYFEETYFDWKKYKYRSRAEQNLSRTKRYLAYYHNMQKAFGME